jgi:hypothetical protein
VLRDFAAALGQTLRAAEGASRKLYGFAEHQLQSTFLGTSAGLRLRHDQPTGRVELNAKSADMARSAWTGVATRDFTDVDIAGLDAGLTERLGWAERTVALPAGRYETLSRPPQCPTCSSTCTGRRGRRRRRRGGRCSASRAAGPASASGCPPSP